MRHCFIAFLICFSAVTLNAAEKTIVGKVDAVDIAKKSITINDIELDLSRKSKIVVSGKKAALKDIKTGQQAKVTYEDTLEIAISVVVGMEDKEATTKDMKSIQGEWKCIAAEENGKSLEQRKIRQESRRLIINGNSLTMDKVKVSWIGKFEIDATNKHFDWIGKGPQNNLVEWVGIYKLDGDTLKLCFIFDKDNKAKRPTEMKSMPPAQPGLAHALYTFKRSR